MAYTNEQRTAYYAGKNTAWGDIECNERTACALTDSVLVKEWKQGYRDAYREEALNLDEAWG